MKRSPSRGSQESGPSPSGKKDSELEVILRRRRNKAGDAGSGGKRSRRGEAMENTKVGSWMLSMQCVNDVHAVLQPFRASIIKTQSEKIVFYICTESLYLLGTYFLQLIQRYSVHVFVLLPFSF